MTSRDVILPPALHNSVDVKAAAQHLLDVFLEVKDRTYWDPVRPTPEIIGTLTGIIQDTLPASAGTRIEYKMESELRALFDIRGQAMGRKHPVTHTATISDQTRIVDGEIVKVPGEQVGKAALTLYPKFAEAIQNAYALGLFHDEKAKEKAQGETVDVAQAPAPQVTGSKATVGNVVDVEAIRIK